MWKDKIKGIFQDVRRGVEEVCEDVKEKVEKAELGEKLKKVGVNQHSYPVLLQ